jgi:hypothetical protein
MFSTRELQPKWSIYSGRTSGIDPCFVGDDWLTLFRNGANFMFGIKQ